MNKLNIAATGYPGTNKSWRFLHEIFAEPLKAIAKLCGDNTILYGCEVTGTNVSDGWVALDGELFYFKTGVLTQGNNTPVTINETIEQAAYNTDINNDTFFDNLDTYFERVSGLNTGQTTVCNFGDLVRLKTVRELSQQVAFMQQIVNEDMLKKWPRLFTGALTDIPTGWQLCDGTNGTPDLRNRFVVGAGNQYNVGAIGGEDTVTLSEDEMPEHHHNGNTSQSGVHGHNGTTSNNGNHRHRYEDTIYIEEWDWGITPGVQGVRLLASGGNNRNCTTDANGDQVWSHYRRFNSDYEGIHTHNLNIDLDGNHSHLVTTENKGSGQAHENRPPYYALCYIIFVGI